MLEHLNLQSRSDALEYDWVDEKVVKTCSNSSIKAALSDADITVGDPSEWLVLLVLMEKRIFNSFDKCVVPFYEWLFTRIGR